MEDIQNIKFIYWQKDVAGIFWNKTDVLGIDQQNILGIDQQAIFCYLK